MTAYFSKAQERIDKEGKQAILVEVLDRFYGYLNYTEERIHSEDLDRYKEFKSACISDIALMLPMSTIAGALENLHLLAHMLADGNFMVRPGLEGPKDNLKFPGNWN